MFTAMSSLLSPTSWTSLASTLSSSNCWSSLASRSNKANYTQKWLTEKEMERERERDPKVACQTSWCSLICSSLALQMVFGLLVQTNANYPSDHPKFAGTNIMLGPRLQHPGAQNLRSNMVPWQQFLTRFHRQQCAFQCSLSKALCHGSSTHCTAPPTRSAPSNRCIHEKLCS